MFVDLTHYQLWDFAGFDGLQFARLLFGEAIDRIAPFQSVETTLTDRPCSVLRLCEANFRVGLQDGTGFERSVDRAHDQRVWVKQCQWMRAIAVSEPVAWNRLLKIAIPKPPHRLEGLQPNCAAPARIDGISVLVWRHQLSGQPAFELHTAASTAEAIGTKLLCIE